MKILVSKPDSLGDQIIVAGLIQQLAEEHPDASVIWQVRHPMQVVRSILPNVSLFEPDLAKPAKAEADRFQQELTQGITMLPLPIDACADWSSNIETTLSWWIEFLRSQNWDLAITALRNRTWFSEITAIATAAPKRITLEKTNAWQPLAETLKQDLGFEGSFYTDEIEFSSEDNEYESFTRLFSVVSSQSDPKGIHLDYPKSEAFPTKTVLFAPGVGFQPLRSWPIDKWIHLSQLLTEKGWTVSWIEGPGDDKFYVNDPIPENQRVRFGSNDLPKLASTIEAAEVLICNDSSYAHLSAAIGTPTLAFYGCGQDQRFIPNRGRVKVIQGTTIEAGSQWHNHCDIWASIRKIPMDSTLEAFQDLTENGNISRVEVPIEVPNVPEELKNPATRNQFLDEHQRTFWENWSIEQATRRAAIKGQSSPTT